MVIVMVTMIMVMIRMFMVIILMVVMMILMMIMIKIIMTMAISMTNNQIWPFTSSAKNKSLGLVMVWYSLRKYALL